MGVAVAYISTNYNIYPLKPKKKWVCTRTSSSGPYDDVPPDGTTGSPDFCGQCVSFVTTVCPSIPVNTGKWARGSLVKGKMDIVPGTAIATFSSPTKYFGHAAIYVSQNTVGINVVDQWVFPPAKEIGPRILVFGVHGNANNGDNFYVVE